MTEHDIQLAIARKFDWFRNIVVPNAFLGSFEMDVAIVTPAGYLWEVEIKTSMGDWRADLKKRKHLEREIMDPQTSPCRFYYAVDCEMLKMGTPPWVPAYAGVLAARPTPWGGLKIDAVRAPKRIHNQRLAPEKIADLSRKVYFRFWQRELAA